VWVFMQVFAGLVGMEGEIRRVHRW
jgi:hypothetical protein